MMDSPSPIGGPLALASRALLTEGALVEESGPGVLFAVLPGPLRQDLALPEEAAISEDGREGTVGCGYGSDLLEGLAERVLGRCPVAFLTTAGIPPKPGRPEAYEGLNVALRPEPAAPGHSWALWGHFLVDAVADDRRRSLVSAAVMIPDGIPIDLGPIAGLDDLAEGGPADLGRAVPALGRLALTEALAAIAPFREAVARRARRDLLRVARYFREMDEEIADRIRRAGARRAGALVKKRSTLPDERRRRMRTIRENAAIRARLTPIAFAFVRIPSAVAPLRVLRKRRSRRILVRFPLVGRTWLPVACEACGRAVRAFGACDEAVHILCSECLSGGPRRCGRCTGRRPDTSVPVLRVEGQDEEIVIEGPGPGSPLLGEEGGGGPAQDEGPSGRPRGGRAGAGQPILWKNIRGRHRQAEDSSSSGDLVRRVRAALEVARGPVSTRDLQATTGLPVPDIRRALGELAVEGLVSKTGRTRGTRYHWLGP